MGLVSCATSPTPSPGAVASVGSYMVVDASYGKILNENGSDTKRSVASLTKIATVAVALDWMTAKGGDKNAMMIVPASAGRIAKGNALGLRPGDRIPVREGLVATMMASDNVAALTLADYFGWQMVRETGGGNQVKVFVNQMNALAKELGMSRTRFTNPHGLDLGAEQFSTARDLTMLAMYALKNPQFNFYASQDKRRVTYFRNGQPMAFDVANTNKLLGFSGVDGIKTGMTPKAGQCIVASARKQTRIVTQADGQKVNVPYRLVAVVLASKDRFSETHRLVDQGWGQYEEWVAGGMVINSKDELLKPLK